MLDAFREHSAFVFHSCIIFCVMFAVLMKNSWYDATFGTMEPYLPRHFNPNFKLMKILTGKKAFGHGLARLAPDKIK